MITTKAQCRIAKIRYELTKMGYILRKDRRARSPLYYVVDPGINAVVLSGSGYFVGVDLDVVADWAGLKL